MSKQEIKSLHKRYDRQVRAEELQAQYHIDNKHDAGLLADCLNKGFDTIFARIRDKRTRARHNACLAAQAGRQTGSQSAEYYSYWVERHEKSLHFLAAMQQRLRLRSRDSACHLQCSSTPEQSRAEHNISDQMPFCAGRPKGLIVPVTHLCLGVIGLSGLLIVTLALLLTG